MFAEVVATVIALILAAFSTMFPGLDASYHLIGLLCIFVLYLVFLCIRLYLRTVSLEKELNDAKQRHRAVSARFDEKRLDLARHQAALQSVEIAVTIAAQSSSKNKLSILYEELQKIKISMNELGDEGK